MRLWEPLDRMVYIYSKLNEQNEIFDFSLMEALKFYMFVKAAEFWEAFSIGKDLPDQMFILFLREDSSNLEEFLLKHLNNVGNGGGLEMVGSNHASKKCKFCVILSKFSFVIFLLSSIRLHSGYIIVLFN